MRVGFARQQLAQCETSVDCSDAAADDNQAGLADKRPSRLVSAAVAPDWRCQLDRLGWQTREASGSVATRESESRMLASGRVNGSSAGKDAGNKLEKRSWIRQLFVVTAAVAAARELPKLCQSCEL